MNKEKAKIIFMHSYSPRTGHNFASEVIKIFSEHVVLAHHRSETRLSRVLESYFNIKNDLIFHREDEDFLDYLFIKDLREKIIEKSDGELVMIKDTSFIGVQRLLEVFPEDHHIILLRDPFQVFNSLFKAMNLHAGTFKNKIKKIGKITGLYPYFYCRKVTEMVIKNIPDFRNCVVIKYEDLVLKNEETLMALKEIFKPDKNMDQIKAEIESIPVINSSFFEEVGAKKIWDMKPKTENFNPVNRKGNSFLVRKGIKLGSKKLRYRLGYL